jgi:O-antigen ligase
VELAYVLLAAALGSVLAVFLLTYKHPDRLLAWLTGLTGGLVAVQIANVHVFTIVTFLWFLTVVRQKRGSWGPASAILVSVLPIALTVVVGDLVGNHLLAFQLLALAANTGMISAKSNFHDRRRMLFGVLTSSTVAACVALLQVSGTLPAQLWHRDISTLGRPTGIYPEPDWLGLFAAIGTILAWRLVDPRAKVRYVLLALNLTALVLAFARAAWVGLAASVIAFLILGLFSRRQARGGAVAACVFVTVLAAAGLALAPTVRADLAGRVQSIFIHDANDISGRARVQQIEGLTRLAGTAPWYGHGLSASGRVGVSGVYDAASTNDVGSNWILAFWVDAKVLALPFVLLLVIATARTARSIPGQMLVLLLVNDLFSNATFFPIMWLALGLALGAPRHPVSAENDGELEPESKAEKVREPQLLTS